MIDRTNIRIYFYYAKLFTKTSAIPNKTNFQIKKVIKKIEKHPFSLCRLTQI